MLIPYSSYSIDIFVLILSYSLLFSCMNKKAFFYYIDVFVFLPLVLCGFAPDFT